MFRVPPLLLLACALTGCPTISGAERGEPCNPQGVCVPGLLCEEGICKAADEIVWERMNRPRGDNLRDVFGTDPLNVFAVGDNGTILRYQGSGLDWVDTKQEQATGFSGQLRAIWGWPGSIWAVGSKVILHWDGVSWSTQQVFDIGGQEITNHSLNAVHGAGSKVYSVGSRTSSPYDKLVLAYDTASRRWDQVAEADPSFTPAGLWVTATGELFVVGQSLQVTHYDGTHWKEHNLNAASAVDLKAIWGTEDASRIYAVGERGVLATYDGQGWNVAEDGRLSFDAHDIWGLAAGDIFVVGDPAGSYSGDKTGIERCATFCTHNPVPDDAKSKTLNAIWISGDGSTVYAAGEDGLILRRNLE